MIDMGILFFNDSVDGSNVSSYHIEAGIGYEYVTAKNYDVINWSSTLALYDLLITNYPSPASKLNRLVVLDKVVGAATALKELLKLNESQFLKIHLYYAIKGDFEKS